ncbi:LysR substrate-binding domain-containing protein [Xanthobacter oligotrophicus]|uniref:LysR substrate-binding domain-containing protein n=1 Tax=Xanthobacter oligotrophicus TaxID=2607286 RepID=UPI0011F33D2B|nr:LysR substrate-binding domain-containing protein [Xanthobacter oligotrophicus]MCG5234893.1 LysR substrate-binding domain-containing protein [Xanthobacter oligotrophicus]
MTLEQLKVFVAVARALHMTRAAEGLHMTQSAVSASVAALEASCGVALFHRVGRRIELTEAGHAFVPEAEAVLARAAAAETVLADLSGLRRGRLALEASQTIANYWLGPVLNRFHKLYPDIALSVVIGNTTQVTAAVREGAADLGFVEGEVEEPLLARTAVPGDRLVLVAAAGSPFAKRRAIAPADLFEMPFVLREPGSGTRQVFEDALRASGLDPAGLKVALELPSNEAVVSAVAAGAGATVISDLVAAAGLATGTLRQLPLTFPARRFYVLRHADRYHSRAAQALMALIREPAAGATIPAKTAAAAPVSRPRSRARR